MKVKNHRSSVKKLITFLEEFDASTEAFLDELPTPEKYAILGMALVVRGDYEDYEIAIDESMHEVSAQDLTKHLIKFPFLSCHLQDALQLKWSHFEVLWTNDEDEDEDCQ